MATTTNGKLDTVKAPEIDGLDEIIDATNLFERPKGRLKDTPEGREYLRSIGQKAYRKGIPSKFQTGEFVAWDGEGITNAKGDHKYILLANSLGSYIQRTDGETLETEACFSFLCEISRENPRAIHVIFSGTYDFNMMLKSLPWDTLERLYETGKARWREFKIDLFMGKRLHVINRETGESFTLWDVFPFFQTSFVASLAAWDIHVTELDNIVEQKGNRSDFQLEDVDEIRAYCFQELDALVKLMESFRESLIDAGITISRWDGPGAIAAYLYRKHDTKSYKCTPPDSVNTAAQYAYAGGRIELIRIGNHDGDCFYYDVRSAYPAQIAGLPSLANARWKHYGSVPEAYEPRVMSLYHVQYSIDRDESFYPIAYRTPAGNIHFPPSCTTWVWTPEYELLRDFFPGTFTVLEAYLFDSEPVYPFGWVAEMFAIRNQWKQEGRPAEKVLKLGLNSLYGKMIQQVGYTQERGLPPFHQLEWGGYVTSATRASLFRAAYGSNAVVGFETDGIITTEPLPLSLGEALGDWEAERFCGITYVQNGLYWLRREDGSYKTKYRGFDRGSLSREMVLDGWDANSRTLRASLTRFRGLGFSITTDGRRKQWGNWITEPRDLAIGECGTKRFSLCPTFDCRICADAGKRVSWANGLHDTATFANVGFAHSTKYPLVWKDGKPEWRQQYLESLKDEQHNPTLS